VVQPVRAGADSAGVATPASTWAVPESRLSVTTTDSGVPVLWAPYGGALRAGLLFRVGQADEALPTRGVTHLAEHLALSTVGQPHYAFNGEVGQVSTSFDVMGAPEEVVAHLERVCLALHSLPVDRLGLEKQILEVEDTRRGDPLGELRRRRYGLAGYGLAGCAELGLHKVDAALLQGWARQVFTAGNAVLWMSGPPPAGLRLPLPPGPRYAAPAPQPRVHAGPTWYAGRGAGLALTALMARGEALGAASWWLERLLHHRLRAVHGHSYFTSVEVTPLAHALSELTVQADGLPGSGDRLVADLLSVLDHAASEGFPEERLDAWRRTVLTTLAEPTAVLGLLDYNARRLLLAEPVRDTAALRADTNAVTPEQVGHVLSQVVTTALLETPADAAAPGPGWVSYPQPTAAVSTGTAFAPAAHLRVGSRLVMGSEGVMVESGTARRTVLWSDCAAVLRWTSGRRQIAGHTGTILTLDPTQWADGNRITSEVDRIAPADRIVDMPDETDDPSTTPVRLSGVAATSTGPLVIIIFSVALAGLMLLSVLGGPGINVAFGAGCLVLLAGVEVWLIRALRRRLRAPKAARNPHARARTKTSVRIDTALARANSRTTLGIAVSAWTIALLLAIGSTAFGATYWPSLIAAAFATRTTLDYRRRRIR
jgi:zinc protease